MKKYLLVLAVVAVLAGVGLSSDSAYAATDYFLKLDGVKGESTNAKHKDQIEIMSWSWGMSNSGSMSSGGGGGAGKVSFQDISLMKKVDKSSPKLFEACASGKHLKEMVLTSTSGKRLDYLKYTFQDVLCTSMTTSGGSDAPMEQVSFSYGKIEMQYMPMDLSGWLRAAWDIVRNVVF